MPIGSTASTYESVTEWSPDHHRAISTRQGETLRFALTVA
jgi:hypothetical protein